MSYYFRAKWQNDFNTVEIDNKKNSLSLKNTIKRMATNDFPLDKKTAVKNKSKDIENRGHNKVEPK